MSTQYESVYSSLVPKYVSGVFRKYEQGYFIGESIIPSKNMDHYSWTYNLYGQVGEVADVASQGSEAIEITIPYDEKFVKAVEWRIKKTIFDRELRSAGNVRNLWNDASVMLGESISLTKEHHIIDTLLDNNPNNELLKGGMPSPIDGKNWSDEGSDIIADLALAKKEILTASKVTPDTLIINEDDLYNIEKHPDFRQYQLAGPMGQDNLNNGMINLPDGQRMAKQGSIKGLDVFLTTAVKKNKGSYPAVGEPNDQRPVVGDGPGEVSRLLEGKAIVLKRGADLGFFGVSEPMQTKIIRLEERRAQSMLVNYGGGSTIIRPNRIIHINTSDY